MDNPNFVPDFNPYCDLHKAAWYGDLAEVKGLLLQGQDVNRNVEIPHRCVTALHCGACQGHIEIVEHLVKNGANLHPQNPEGFTPLDAAVWNGHLDVVQFLHGQGADIHKGRTQYNFTPLQTAAWKGRDDIVGYLIKHNVEVNANTSYGYTPLMSACYKGEVKIVDLLLNSGANVDNVTSFGWTALKVAAQQGHLEVVKLLVKYGCDLIEFGGSAIGEARNAGHNLIVYYLKKERDQQSYTPLMSASYRGEIEVVDTLLNDGANVNDVTSELGVTALKIAAQQGYLEVVKLLVEYGADLEKYGGNAIGETRSRGHHYVVDYLKIEMNE